MAARVVVVGSHMRGVTPYEVSFNTSISACEKGGQSAGIVAFGRHLQWLYALSVLEAMCGVGVALIILASTRQCPHVRGGD